jgi:chorismate mutase
MTLKELREAIDRIDEEITRKLEERLALARRTRTFKSGIDDPGRERDILERLEALARGLPHLRPEFVAAVYREIFRESRRVQQEEES